MTKSEAFPLAVEMLEIAVKYISDDIREDIQAVIVKLKEIDDQPEIEK